MEDRQDARTRHDVSTRTIAHYEGSASLDAAENFTCWPKYRRRKSCSVKQLRCICFPELRDTDVC